MTAPRPLRLEYIDPAQLAEHPANWKFHPPEQSAALADFLQDVGWAGAMLFNERTGRLLDGHGRKAVTPPGELVPVLVGSWDDQAERKILGFLDPLGWMAKTDRRAFDALAEAGKLLDAPGQSEQLRRLAEAVRESGELLDGSPAAAPATDGDGVRPEEPKRPPAADVPDALWPSDNPDGVPVLDLALQADAVEFPVTLWGSQGQTKAMRGTWHFYTNDQAFRVLWDNPGKVLPSSAPCLVEPNYSTHEQMPFAVELWGIYRKRWLARYWQAQGRRVFVDINVHHRLLIPHEATPGHAPALLGVPRGWKAYASRAHANRPEMLEAEYDIACEHARGCTPLFLVYGGGTRVRDLARARGWAWVAEENDRPHGTTAPAAGPERTEESGVTDVNGPESA